jgi:hypothetical protein
MFESKPLVAFDQHAASVTAAVLFPGARRPAVHQLVPDRPTIRRFVKKFRRHGARPLLLRGQPCGFELQRTLTADGVACDVIAPALIPRRAGDRIKHDAWSRAGSVTSRTSSHAASRLRPDPAQAFMSWLLVI